MSAQRQRGSSLTEAQRELIGDLDDVSEHVAWEFDPDEYRGISTCGFAHVGNIDGRASFVRRVQSLADTGKSIVQHGRNSGYRIQVGSLEMLLREDSYRGGYRLSIANVGAYINGPEYQRMDVRERLHGLVLERLQYNGYLSGARVYSRMD